MPVTRVPSWGSPAEAQLSPCRAGALGGVHLQGLAVSASPLGNHRRSSCQILCSWLLRCWSALCAQPPQLPVPAELHRASRALLMVTAPVGKCRELQPGPTSSFCSSAVQERSLLGFLLCQDHSHKQGRTLRGTLLVASLNSLFCIL